KLRQILINLLGNAIKFTNKGFAQLTCKCVDAGVEFSVADSGIGIPDELLDKIFDRFYQVSNSVSRLYDGTGLGLSIARAYARELGGDIRVLSEIGRGSEFILSVPVEGGGGNLQGQDHQKNTPGIQKYGKRVLIADDEGNNGLLIRLYLEGLGLDYKEARNGRQAVDICRNDDTIDLVLMDIKMPVMDGFEATRQIKKIRPGLPVIGITAYAFESDRENVLACGCNDYLSKPFNKHDLTGSVKKYLGLV
ncbi:MAG: ATP-binding protein, partial [Bacteroidales bacterium]|nr:ATP-binding protein [Bacteroidales bacterium]